MADFVDGFKPRNMVLSQPESSVSTDNGQVHYGSIEQPSASQAQHQNIFDTPFNMHAMHDSLPVSESAAPAFPPSSLSQSIDNAANDRTQIRPIRLDSDMNDGIDGSPDEDYSSPILLGKGRSTLTVNGSGHKSPPILFTPKTGVPQSSSSSSKAQKSSPFSTQSSSKLTTSIAYSDDCAVSAAKGGLSPPPLSTSPSVLDASIAFTERKLDPYSDVSVLGRRIILVMFELEQSSPIYPTAEVNTRYQGVDVATIMTRMHSLDNNLTAKDVE